MCPEDTAVGLTNPTLLSDGSLLDNNFNISYPIGTFWKENGSYYGCTCQVWKCPLRCCEELILNIVEYYQSCEKLHNGTYYFNPLKIDTAPDVGPSIRIRLGESEYLWWHPNGTIDMGHEDYVPDGDYCINSDGNDFSYFEVLPRTFNTFDYVLVVMKSASLVCIILTLAAHFIIRRLRNLYGKCHMSYMISLFFSFLFLIVDKQLYWDQQNLCVITGTLAIQVVKTAI